MSSNVILRWNGDKIRREIKSAVFGIVVHACETLADEIKRKLDVPGPPASTPGEYPHKRTAGLQEGIEVVSNESRGTAAVVSTADYTEHVEEIRPFFRRAFVETLPMLQRQVEQDAERVNLG